jgi:hypothetical protein
MKSNYIVFDGDFITIIHNENLKNKPYLVRFINFDNEQYEIRMSKEDLDKFINFLSTFTGAKVSIG